ncbi:MAG: hypothetical protein E3J21_25730 [Anaerolineales bacterium]|nr:MAG: hypothetical protein E3J21_25730 [Anaerolineales bacterium]
MYCTPFLLLFQATATHGTWEEVREKRGESETRPGDCRTVGGAVDARARKPAIIGSGVEYRLRGRLRTEHDWLDRHPPRMYRGRVRPVVAVIQMEPWSVRR